MEAILAHQNNLDASLSHHQPMEGGNQNDHVTTKHNTQLSLMKIRFLPMLDITHGASRSPTNTQMRLLPNRRPKHALSLYALPLKGQS